LVAHFGKPSLTTLAIGISAAGLAAAIAAPRGNAVALTSVGPRGSIESGKPDRMSRAGRMRVLSRRPAFSPARAAARRHRVSNRVSRPSGAETSAR
jgi:hypothetical protein